MMMTNYAMADGGGGGSTVYEVAYKDLYSKGNSINNQIIYSLQTDIKNAYTGIKDLNLYWTAVDTNSAYARLVRGVNTTIDQMNEYLKDFNEIPKNLQLIANNYSKTDTQTESGVGSPCTLKIYRIKPILEKANATEMKHDAAEIRASLFLINQDFNSAKNVANMIKTMVTGLNWSSTSASGLFKRKTTTLCTNFASSIDNITKAITDFINEEIETVRNVEVMNRVEKRYSSGSVGGSGRIGGPHNQFETIM